jgi:hypothetical protein
MNTTQDNEPSLSEYQWWEAKAALAKELSDLEDWQTCRVLVTQLLIEKSLSKYPFIELELIFRAVISAEYPEDAEYYVIMCENRESAIRAKAENAGILDDQGRVFLAGVRKTIASFKEVSAGIVTELARKQHRSDSAVETGPGTVTEKLKDLKVMEKQTKGVGMNIQDTSVGKKEFGQTDEKIGYFI